MPHECDKNHEKKPHEQILEVLHEMNKRLDRIEEAIRQG